MRKLYALFAAVIVLAFCGGAFADREEQFVREEAARRNITLLTVEQARDIAIKQFTSGNVRVKDIDLED